MENLGLSKKCRVCGDKALGFNFNGLSCESCKIFFRRNAHRPEKFTCRKVKCDIDIFTRKCCQKCRLDKCFLIGMKKELIRSKRLNRDSINSESDEDSIAQDQDESSKIPEQEIDLIDYENSTATPNHSQHLQTHELERIQELQSAMEVFCDETKLEIVAQGTSLIDAFNFPGLYIKHIIRFCKKLSAFQSLKQNDQLTMLKEAFCHIQTIRFSFVYNLEKDGFPVMLMEESEENNKGIFIKMNVFRQWRRKNVESFFRRIIFSLQAEMENDVNIRNLMIAYSLFKQNSANVSCPELIRYHHYIYRHLLRRYFEHKYRDTSKTTQKLATITSLFSELDQSAELCREMFVDIDSSQMIQVLNEIFLE